MLVALDEVSNAENLGALVRNCVAFGVQGLIVGETSSSPFLRRAVRNSMGAIFQLPVFEIGAVRGDIQSLRRDDPVRQLTLVQVLRDLRARGIRCIAAHPHASARLFRRQIFQAIAALFSAAKATAFANPCWTPAMKRWRFPCRQRWIH
ncbi:MAG: TrmH family RNA methyltransferase [Limisphaerales bacterium]